MSAHRLEASDEAGSESERGHGINKCARGLVNVINSFCVVGSGQQGVGIASPQSVCCPPVAAKFTSPIFRLVRGAEV
jgi:hypothetical protein